MQQLKVFNTREKKEVIESLNETYGFKGMIDGVLLFSSKQKYYLLSRDVEKIPLQEEKKLRIDKAGLYIGRKTPEGIRLSIEGSQLIGPKSSKNILEINDEEIEPWVQGQDLDLDDFQEQGFFLVKYNNDFLGCAQIKKSIAYNLVTKNRRIKTLNK
ncbi:MAG: hypothetical protein KKF46_01365 [Nanoarchaeota archaeon]|nr:hypothetical protein [Nanoarchaeota archaeon]MBU1320982.1 hypothetical protein [Nanoarchaeota archaeon]MBU1598367.1 hypothetical protein [Nanoarchaeota archaeon]MBU2441731.1 hypothetical protein [Nanoarchaeota archaeon]